MSEVFTELFITCFKELHDKEYCRSVVEAIAELSETRRVTYRGKKGVTYVLNLPRNDQPYVLLSVDHVNRKLLVVTVVGEGYIIFLTYERGDRFYPIHTEVANAEIAAVANHNMPSGVLQRLMGSPNKA
jgi:hypothetical protein